MSTYFRRFVGAVCVAICSADWESVNVVIGLERGMRDSSWSMPASQLVWRVVSEVAMISASQVLRATKDCRCEPQLMGEPCNVWTDPDIDFLDVGSLAKSASAYANSGVSCGWFGNEMPCVGVCFRKRISRFKCFQCRCVGLWLALASAFVKNCISGLVESVRYRSSPRISRYGVEIVSSSCSSVLGGERSMPSEYRLLRGLASVMFDLATTDCMI